MATRNIRVKNIYDTMEFVIEKIENYGKDYVFQLDNERFNEEDFPKSFIPSFCLTVYKYQGDKIICDYNIYDINRTDKKHFYTALSRTTKFNHIHLDKKLSNKYFVNRKMPAIELVNAKQNLTFKNGKFTRLLLITK